MRINNNLFRNYPDAMSLSQMAECLGISTKLASKLVLSGEVYAVKVGRSYRIAKTGVMEYLQDRRSPHGPRNCVGSVTSNPKGWTSKEICGMLGAEKPKKEAI